MLAFFVWSAASVNAQVLISSQSSDPDAAPHDGAVLDLQSDGTHCLLMPQVTLTSAYEWTPLAGNAVNGMTVFNLSDATDNELEGQGVYVWIKMKWRIMYHANYCDGAIIKAGARDYKESPTSGDVAKAGGADNGSPSPFGLKLLPGTIQDRGDGNYVNSCLAAYNNIFTDTGKDLCVYKVNGNSGGTTDWANAVNQCADGSYADGDAGAGWYLPNVGELMSIFLALGCSETERNLTDFAAIQAPSYVTTTAESMIPDRYWSSTQNSTIQAYPFVFPYSSSNMKTGAHYVRCVRRM